MDAAAIAESAAEHDVSYLTSDLFTPVHLTIFPYDRSLGKEDKDLFDYALLNVLSELLDDPRFSVETIQEFRDYNWILVLKWSQASDPAAIESAFLSFIQQANKFLKSDACCCIADTAELDAFQAPSGSCCR